MNVYTRSVNLLRFTGLIFLAVVVLGVSTTFSFAQQAMTSATVSGRIEDSNGGAVSGATTLMIGRSVLDEIRARVLTSLRLICG